MEGREENGEKEWIIEFISKIEKKLLQYAIETGGRKKKDEAANGTQKKPGNDDDMMTIRLMCL